MSIETNNLNQRIRPTFINVGPGRCATSWLLEALRSHPEVEMANVKETEYFNTYPERDAQWYESHFLNAGNAIGEISSNYYLDHFVPDRIANYDPSLRLIINLRNPYTLMESFYQFGIRRGLTLPPLEEALDVPIGKLMGSGFEARAKRDALTVSDEVTLLDSVCLSDRLESFVKTFPKEQIYFFVFERLQTQWQDVLEELYAFIKVDPSWVPPNADTVVNSSVQPKSVLLARLATKTASALRAMGLYGMLDRLHKSETLKRVIFSSKTSPANRPELATQLPKHVVKRIDEQIDNLKRLHPPLARLWQ